MTQRGHLKLLHGGFEFIKERTTKNGNQTSWVCSMKRRFYCKGRAQTRRIGAKEIVELYGIHNHLPMDTDAEK